MRKYKTNNSAGFNAKKTANQIKRMPNVAEPTGWQKNNNKHQASKQTSKQRSNKDNNK